jgi:hypothetical protein
LTDRPGPRARVDVQRDQSSTEDAHTHTCKCTHTCMRARTNTLGAPTAPTGSKPLLRRLKGTPLVLQPLADEGAQPPTKRASSHHALQKTCRSQVQLDRNAGIRRGREAEIDTVQRGKGGGAGAASAPHGGAAMETASSYDPSTTGFNSSTPTTGHGSTSVSGMGSEVCHTPCVELLDTKHSLAQPTNLTCQITKRSLAWLGLALLATTRALADAEWDAKRRACSTRVGPCCCSLVVAGRMQVLMSNRLLFFFGPAALSLAPPSQPEDTHAHTVGMPCTPLPSW